MDIQKTSASNKLYDTLRQRIITAGFALGTKLKSEELKREYLCSASAMREALFRLSCEGFIDFEEQKGFRVPRVSEKTLQELTHLRVLLESEGARLSIEKGDLEWEGKLTAAHHKLAHIENAMWDMENVASVIDVWFEAEWEFHYTLISACGQELLLSTYRNIYDRYRQHLVSNAPDYGIRRQSIVEHKQIMDAALARNSVQCCEHIKAHLENNLDPAHVKLVA